MLISFLLLVFLSSYCYLVERFPSREIYALDFFVRIFRKEPVYFDGKLKPKEDLRLKVNAYEIKDGASIDLAKVNFNFSWPDGRRRELKKIKFKNCVFSHETIESLTFSRCVFVSCYFNGTKFKNIEFDKCDFFECAFYKSRFILTYIDPKLIYFSEAWKWDRANINTGLFQDLYRNSRNMHQEVFAMEADKKFQFYRRYQYIRGGKGNKVRMGSFFVGFLYDWLLGYGYGIWNTLFVTMAMISGFSIFMSNGITRSDGNALEPLSALYFSIVSFTTVGYGEITTKYDPISLIATMFFLLCSVVWCAIVTAIIVKRIVK